MAKGIAAKKLDFRVIPKLGLGLILLLWAMHLSGKPILSFIYR